MSTPFLETFINQETRRRRARKASLAIRRRCSGVSAAARAAPPALPPACLAVSTYMPEHEFWLTGTVRW